MSCLFQNIFFFHFKPVWSPLSHSNIPPCWNLRIFRLCFSQLCCLTSSSPARGSSRPGGSPTQRMTPQSGGFSFTSTSEPTSSPSCPLGGVGGRGEGGAAGDVGSGCSPITDCTERDSGPWLMLSMGPGFRFRLKGKEWNLLSLGNEAGGGALEGGGDWLKSGGVSVRDLAGSSPTEDKKTQSKELQDQQKQRDWAGLAIVMDSSEVCSLEKTQKWNLEHLGLLLVQITAGLVSMAMNFQ